MVSDKVLPSNGSQRIFTIGLNVLSESHLKIYLDGVAISADDYDLINNAAVFHTAPAEGTLTLQVGTTPDDLLLTPTDAGIVAGKIDSITLLADNIDIIEDLVYSGTGFKQEWTATAGQTTFTIDYTVGFIDIYLNGVKLTTDDYTAANGTTVILDEGCNVDDAVEIRAFGTFDVPDSYSIAESDNRYALPVAEVTDLTTTLALTSTTAIVKDSNRGGVFIYDATQSGVNNGGTIFNGWVRQYDGAVNVKWFGAVGDGATDDTASIQSAIDNTVGKVYIPKGVFLLSSTIKLKIETILIGDGAGAYFSGGGYDRITVLKPISGFADSDVLRADPSDVSSGLTYTYGVAIRDMLIDCINIKDDLKTIIKLASLSNSETFDSVRIINNNRNVGLDIGISSNVSSLLSDGIIINNFYFLQAEAEHTHTTALVKLASCNEVSFRDCKFQRGSDVTVTNTISVLISAAPNTKISAVTFDSCSFTGAETGLKIQGNDTDGEGPRWIRVKNCTFEGLKYPISLIGTSSRRVQFCTLGSGNRMITVASGGVGIKLGDYSSNNSIEADEVTTIETSSNASGNFIIGGNSFTDNGTDNARIYRDNNVIAYSSLYSDWVRPTIGASWVDTTTSRNQAGYRKDSIGNVYLKGYLTGGSWGYPNYIFTLPEGYRPPVAGRALEIVATGDDGIAVKIIILDNGKLFASGSGAQVCLDGIQFNSNS